MKIHFFHTNDVHSHFEEFLQVTTQLRRKREEALAAGEIAFTFEIGDNADRKRMETEGTLGRTNAALLKQIGYDAWTFGNNEGLTISADRWHALVEAAQMPLLVANLSDLKTGERLPELEPYLVLERGGIRIGVIGLTAAFVDFYKLYSIAAELPQSTLKRLLPELERERVDMVVLLSHLGLDLDRKIAAEFPEIDIIFGGHSHHILTEPEQVGRTLICQAGSYGSHYGHLSVEWDAQRRERKSYSGGAVPRNPAEEPDHELVELFARWQEEAADALSEVITELAEPLEHALAGNSPLANVVTDRLRRLTGAPIAMINGGLLMHGLIAGPVTRADMLTCCPGPNTPVVVELTGAQILSLLQKGLDKAYIERVGKGHGFRGHFVGGLQVSGLLVQVAQAEAGLRVVAVEHDGAPLDPARHYEVAAVDYLYFSSVYEEFKQGQAIRFELPFLRELLASELGRSERQDSAPRYLLQEVREK